jgi:hypothetical protein
MKGLYLNKSKNGERNKKGIYRKTTFALSFWGLNPKHIKMY